MTLLSLLFAAPASADTVTPVRDCSRGNGYHHLDGEYSASAAAPAGYLIASYCVDSGGRRGGSEVHTLEPPQRTTTVWHSEGRPLRGYSVTYVRASESGQPEPEPEPEPGESSGSENDQDDGSDAPSATQDADEEQGADGDDRTAAPGPAEQREPNEPNERTSSAAPEPKPSRKPSAVGPATSESPSQMTALSDGEELTVTSLAEKSAADDDETLRDLVVAGSIIVIGLLAGAVALLVRLPGQR
ncbi:hypothetical protein ACFV9G_07335 [Nocardioides sp. NPDC059952]|uniref:hypothetical protein n=1 Tax=Nocardioides sp. NPDC059952 TaxID=3347014 RepID=UPI00364B4B19